MVTFKAVIKENQVDFLGHLNNLAYLELFEEARWDILNNNGYTLKKMFELQNAPVTLEQNLKFSAEVVARDSVIIKSEMYNHEEKSEYLGAVKKTKQNS